MDQKLEMLSKVPMFAGCRSAELVEIGKLAEEVGVKARSSPRKAVPRNSS